MGSLYSFLPKGNRDRFHRCSYPWTSFVRLQLQLLRSKRRSHFRVRWKQRSFLSRLFGVGLVDYAKILAPNKVLTIFCTLNIACQNPLTEQRGESGFGSWLTYCWGSIKQFIWGVRGNDLGVKLEVSLIQCWKTLLLPKPNILFLGSQMLKWTQLKRHSSSVGL